MPSLEEFLAIVGDQAKPTSERSEVWDRLYEDLYVTVRKIVETIAASYYRQWGDTFETENLTIVLMDHLKDKILQGLYDGNKPFRAWCRVVVSNYVKGIYQDLKREELRLKNYAERAKPEDIARIIEQISGPLRKEMDAFIRWYDKTIRSDAHHFPSIIWIRLRVVVKATHACAEPDQFVPWREREKWWRFQEFWPTILAIWTLLDSKDHYESQEIADAVNVLLQESQHDERINASFWNTRVSRAANKVNVCAEPIPIMKYLMIRNAPPPHLSPSDD